MEQEFLQNSNFFIDLIINELDNFPNLKKHFSTNERIINYNLYENEITTYFKNIMEKYLIHLNLNNTNCNFSIDSNIKSLGRFTSPNKIIINNIVIENIQRGNFEYIETIFHELFHFKLYSEIQAGIVNKTIVDLIKDILLRDYCFDYYGSMKNKEGLPNFVFDTYYNDNYENTTGEILAELYGTYCTLIFFNKFNTQIDDNKLLELKNVINLNYQKYTLNQQINFENIDKFNSNHLTIDDAFDSAIHFNPNWIKDIPQLQIEYYLNEEGIVCKRTIEELEAYKNTITDESVKEYINDIINKEKNNINIKTI